MSRKTVLGILLTIIGLMADVNLWAADTVSVSIQVNTPGTFSTLVGTYNEKMKTTHLKVSGLLNGTDIQSIREMGGALANGINSYGKLTNLDLSEAAIVAGGSYYWIENLPPWMGPKSLYTADNQIGTRMFEACYVLQKVILPGNAISVGDYAFNGCSGMTSVSLPEGITSIGTFAFNGCSKLSAFSIPNSVSTLGLSAFKDCSALTRFQIPESVTFDVVQSLVNCSKLVEFQVSENNPVYSSMDGMLCSKDRRQVICFPAGKTSCSLPDTVTFIADNAFSGCKNLTALTMQNNIISIGSNAFMGCTSLTSVRIPEKVKVLSDGIFSNCTSLISIEIPAGVTSIGYRSFFICTRLSSVTLPDGLIFMGESAFESCKALLSISIPSGIKSVAKGLLAACTNLKTINLPDSLIEINDGAFQSCSSLTTLTLPLQLKSISDWCFWDCTGLRSLYCNALTPPSATSKSFLNVPMDSCRLYVPTGSKNLYEQAIGWSTFQNMEEPSGWGNRTKTANGLRIIAKAAHIQLEGAEIGDVVSVYSVLGVLIKKVEVFEKTTTLWLPPHRCYLLRTKNQSATVSL